MSKLTTTLESLTKFQQEIDSLDTRINGLVAEKQKIAQEFNQWMTNEFGFGTGPQSMPLVIKTVLEKSYDTTSRIITS